jgi:hypothetical protein
MPHEQHFWYQFRDDNFPGIPGNPFFSSDFWGFPEWVFPI